MRDRDGLSSRERRRVENFLKGLEYEAEGKWNEFDEEEIRGNRRLGLDCVQYGLLSREEHDRAVDAVKRAIARRRAEERRQEKREREEREREQREASQRYQECILKQYLDHFGISREQHEIERQERREEQRFEDESKEAYDETLDQLEAEAETEEEDKERVCQWQLWRESLEGRKKREERTLLREMAEGYTVDKTRQWRQQGLTMQTIVRAYKARIRACTMDEWLLSYHPKEINAKFLHEREL